MKLSRLFTALTALSCVGASDSKETTGEQLRDLVSVFNDGRLFCTLYMSHSLPVANGSQTIETLRCKTDDNIIMYTVTDVPTNFFEETPFLSGSIRISVLNSCVYDNDYINMTAGDAEMLGSTVSNRSADTKATRTVIVMRVIDSRGVGPTLSKKVFANEIFGLYGDVLNLSTGYARCSGNELQFAPGVYRTATNGVMDLTLSASTEGMTAGSVENLARAAMGAISDFNQNAYNHIMFILDPTINLLAYAYINGNLSVFQDKWASRPSALMHELGHNLGHLHSGDDESEENGQYRDRSGMMGFSYLNDEGPKMCFNAAKSWFFGWYSSRHADLNPLNAYGNQELNLIGVNDFVNGQSSSEHTTIVRISGGTEQLFMMYNKAEGVNSGTVMNADRVNIVTQPGFTEQSWTRATLSDGESYTVNNFDGSGGKLVVKVCETVAGTPDVARVLVYLTTVKILSCSSPNPPTQAPAPPTPPPCNNNKQQLRVQIKTDNKGSETRFYLKRRNLTTNKYKTVLYNTKLTSDAVNKFYVCVNVQKYCYKLKVRDSGRDGINDGYIKMFKDDVQTYSNAFSEVDGGRKRQKKFGFC